MFDVYLYFFVAFLSLGESLFFIIIITIDKWVYGLVMNIKIIFLGGRCETKKKTCF